MTKQELAQSIKQKYPQYQEVDNEELANKILAKYPVYQSQIEEKGTLRKIGDFFTSGTQKFGKTLGTAASVIDQETTKQREGALDSQREAESNIQKLLNQAKTQDPEQAKRTLQQVGMLSKQQNIDIFNDQEYQKTAKQIYGEGLETLLETAQFSTFGGKGLKTGELGKEIPTVLKPLTTGKDILKGAKTGAGFGGVFGAGFGVAEAMQEDKSIGEIAKAGFQEGAIGAGGGAVIGGGLSALAKGAANLTSRAQKLVSVSKTSIGEKAYNKLVNVSNDLMKMSPTQTRNEAKWNKNTPKFLVDEGVVNLIDSDGKKIVTDEAVGALRDKYHAESRAFNSLLTDSGEYVSLDKFKKQAINDLGDKYKTKGTDYKKAIKQIEDEVTAYKENYRNTGLVDGDDLLVNISDFNKIKDGLWSKTSNFNPTVADKLLSDINYRMGQTAKTLIEDTVEDVAVKRMNNRLGDFASAINVLERANGKVLPGGFFGKAFTRLAGTIAGSGAGVPGSIAGNLTGSVLADAMMSPQIKTGILTKILNTVKKQKNGQSIIEEANEILMRRGEERAARKLLEESKIIIVGPKTVPESKIEIIPAKKTTGRDPETGRFKRVFLSGEGTKEEVESIRKYLNLNNLEKDKNVKAEIEKNIKQVPDFTDFLKKEFLKENKGATSDDFSNFLKKEFNL